MSLPSINPHKIAVDAIAAYDVIYGRLNVTAPTINETMLHIIRGLMCLGKK